MRSRCTPRSAAVRITCGTIAAGIGVLLCGLCQGPALAVALSAIATVDDEAAAALRHEAVRRGPLPMSAATG